MILWRGERGVEKIGGGQWGNARSNQAKKVICTPKSYKANASVAKWSHRCKQFICK